MTRNSKIKFTVISILCIWMAERDWQHVKDKDALENVVVTQSRVIQGMECGTGDIEMILPIQDWVRT